MVEQAFVDVADLFDAQRAEGEPARLGVTADADLQELQRLQGVEYGAVVDGEWIGERAAPRRPLGTPFEEGEAIGIEETTAIGADLEAIMLHAAVHCAERREEAAPGIAATFKDFLTVLVGDFAELLAERGHGVVLIEERVAQQEQAAFFGREQKDQPHHDGDGGLVDLGDGNVF